MHLTHQYEILGALWLIVSAQNVPSPIKTFAVTMGIVNLAIPIFVVLIETISK